MATSSSSATPIKTNVKASAATKQPKATTPAVAKPKVVKPKVVRAPAATATVDDENATITTGESSVSDGSTVTPKKKVLAVADPELDRRLKDVLTGFDEVIARIREGKQNLTDLKKAYHQQIKEINKRRKRTGTATGNGFKIPSLVRGTKLHDFMGVPHGERLARQAVTTRIHDYAVEKGLQREGNRKCIDLDSTLEEILGTTAERLAILKDKQARDKEGETPTKVTEDVGYFNLQTFLKKWFVTKAEEAKMNVSSAASSSATVSS